MLITARIFLILIVSGQTSYKSLYKDDYNNAIQFVKQNQKVLNTTCNYYNNEYKTVLSIVFPELIRYSYFKDFFETTALELIYVQYGKDYADFSIGNFQMKPSFIEKMEESLIGNDTLKSKYKIITEYKTAKPESIRHIRIARMKLLKWQLIYANCFIDLMNHKCKEIQWANETEKIRFYATAYNHGYYKSREEIEKWQSVKTFPYGGTNPNNQFSYCDISSNFFSDQIKNKNSTDKFKVLTNK